MSANFGHESEKYGQLSKRNLYKAFVYSDVLFYLYYSGILPRYFISLNSCKDLFDLIATFIILLCFSGIRVAHLWFLMSVFVAFLFVSVCFDHDIIVFPFWFTIFWIRLGVIMKEWVLLLTFFNNINPYYIWLRGPGWLKELGRWI